MARIFISYSRQDETFARQLINSLQDIGGDIWIDREGIKLGENWANSIQQALDTCEVMLLIISPTSMASENVTEEWQYYRQQRKSIIPILLKTTKIHFQLVNLQYIDFLDQSYTTAFNQLHAELRRKGISLTPLSVSDSSVKIPAQKPLEVRSESHSQPITKVASKKWRILRWILPILLALIVMAVVLLKSQEQPTPSDTSTSTAEATEAIAALASTERIIPTAEPTSRPTDTATPSDTPTHTATPDDTQTEQVQASERAAVRTQIFEIEAAGYTATAVVQTTTAEAWTDTPTPTVTYTPRRTPTRLPLPVRTAVATRPTATPTSTATPTPTTEINLQTSNPNLNVVTPAASEQVFNPPLMGVIFSPDGRRVRIQSDDAASASMVREITPGTIVSASRRRSSWYFIGDGWVSGIYIQFGNTTATIQALVTQVMSFTPFVPTDALSPTYTSTATLTPSHTPTRTPRPSLTPITPTKTLVSPAPIVPTRTLTPTLTPTSVPTITPSACMPTSEIQYFNPPGRGFILTDTGQRAIVRCGPGTGYDELGRYLEVRTEVTVFAESQGWFLIGDGWIQSGLVRFAENIATVTVIVRTVAAYTPPPTPTPIPTDTPIPPSDTPAPSGSGGSGGGGSSGGITIVSVSGEAFNAGTRSCRAAVQVSGGPVTGHFRVANAGFDDNGYPTTTISTGTHYVSFGGWQPGEKNHSVKFEYQGGGSSNTVSGSCSGFPYPN